MSGSVQQQASAAGVADSLPTISVVTPSKDQRPFLESTMRSVLRQDYEALEYVVVDGGSTDGSAELIEAQAGRLAHWVSEPDEGYADAINKGFAHTTGEIMCWINSSDMHYPWTLATVGRIFRELPEVDWLMGLPSYFSSRDDMPKSIEGGVFNIYDFLAGNYRWVQQESCFWRRSLWERAGGQLDTSLKHAADFDLWLRFMPLAPLYHAGTVLGGFRDHGDRLGTAQAYDSEARHLFDEFARRQGRQTLARARLLRLGGISGRRSRLVGRVLNKAGVWPWYRHPHVYYDFQRDTWLIH